MSNIIPFPRTATALVREYTRIHAQNSGASGNDAAIATRIGLHALDAGHSVARACTLARSALKNIIRSSAA